jgi:hypothetical protein
MAVKLEFKNVGHFFASGFKNLAGGLKDFILFANKSQVVAPEVEALVGALAGPLGGDIADLSFAVLGEVAAVLQKPGSTNAVTVTLEQDTVDRIKKAAAVVESIIAAIGGKKPTQ